MCGIAGIFNFTPGIVQESSIRSMTKALSHRGPDADGYYFNDHVGFGHRRLSIIDLSALSNQPFTDISGRYVVVVNGELYNFQEIRNELPDYPFLTSGDTETLVAAFAKWGPECVNRIKGMFAFALWDKQEELLYICRDRMGVKPLYYHLNDNGIIFASEIRSILASGLVPRKLNKTALPDYLSFQSFGYPLSPIEGIRQLQAGSILKISKRGVEKTIYWSIAENKPEFDFQDEAATHERIRQLLRKAVQSRLVSDVQVGAFLSGGIDSSIIVGLMAEMSSVKPSTFNISFSEKEYDESFYAQLVAKRFNTNHTTLELSPEVFLNEMENAMNAMDSPSADGLNTFVVSKAISKTGVKVALSGVGGDELFARYPFYNKYLQLQRHKKVFDHTFLLRKTVADILRKSNSGKNHRIASILAAKTVSISNIYPEFRRIISPLQIRQITNINWNGGSQLFTELTKNQDRFGQLPFLSQVSAAEYLGYTQHTLLKDTDQMSMAVSLEVREPFFDHDLVNFMLFVPDSFKYHHNPNTSLVGSVMPMLPKEILHREKQGFLFPWQVWMKNQLKSFCETRIDFLCQREFINGANLRLYWKRFLENDPTIRWTEIWLFVVLEYWMERNQVES